MLSQVAQHEERGTDHRRGVRNVLSGNVGGGAVDGFKDGALVADVGARHQAKAADEGSTEVGNDVSVEILHQQHVVLVRVHYQLHAGVVDDVLAVGDLGILFRDIALTVV